MFNRASVIDRILGSLRDRGVAVDPGGFHSVPDVQRASEGHENVCHRCDFRFSSCSDPRVAFELTPEGIRRAEGVAPRDSKTPETGRKWTAIILAAAVLAAALLVFQFARTRPDSTAQLLSKLATEEPLIVLLRQHLRMGALRLDEPSLALLAIPASISETASEKSS